MQPGKLPHDILARLLRDLPRRDPRVLLGPGVGRDAAVIDTGGPRLLVAKADPITFASEEIGWYAVHVNANDIACTGARPLWFLATILLPAGSTPSLPESIFAQAAEACEALGIEIVGGHTEITIGLDRPIVSGAMLGEAERDGLVRPDGARAGDALVLTKGIAIEGTAVLAREAAPALRKLGVPVATVETARRYIRTPGTEGMYADPEIYEGRRKGVPMGRVGSGEDIAGPAIFLASDEARYTSGSVLGADGAQAVAYFASVPGRRFSGGSID